MLGTIILFTWMAWLVIAIRLARWAKRSTGHGRSFWIVLLSLLMLPVIDVVAGALMGLIWLSQLPDIIPETPIHTRGIREELDSSLTEPISFEFLDMDTPLEFVESEYLTVPFFPTNSRPFAPGYLQFRSTAADSLCPLQSGQSSGEFVRLRDRCWRVSRTATPLARYAHDFVLEPRPMWLVLPKVRVSCDRVVNLDSNAIVVRKCSGGIGSWYAEGSVLSLPFRRRSWHTQDFIRPL